MAKLLNMICAGTFLLGGWACHQGTEIESTDWGEGVSKELATVRKENISEVNYQLFFDIPEEKQQPLKGRTEVSFQIEDEKAFALDFKADQQQIDSVLLNGKRVDYQFKDEHILLGDASFAADRNAVTVYFTCSDQSLNRRDDFLYTLLVPDRARTLFPCFDQPDMKAVYELSLETPSKWKAVANGKVRAEKMDTPVERNFISFEPTEPLSTYLFAFAAGELSRETYQRGDRSISVYHRENDPDKVAQCPAIADEVFNALEWMEAYSGIPYPFAKYDLVILPGFQFGGMEHTGATFYNDSRMFLNEHPTLQEQLGRSSLIAHETTHMWFGDYVTMEWFDDVWTKEVFANYFASRMVESLYPDVNHRLNFMSDYLPGSYAEDRTAGSNAIKQELDNLQNAGLVYGNIIYDKSPVLMEMLVKMMGEKNFRNGIREYLQTYAYGNATWDGLIAILDGYDNHDLKSWSHRWVNEKGMPVIKAHLEGKELVVSQSDPWGRGINWPQQLTYLILTDDKEERVQFTLQDNESTVRTKIYTDWQQCKEVTIVPNEDGRGYGLFQISDKEQPGLWKVLSRYNSNRPEEEVLRGSLLITLYENLRKGHISPETFRKEGLDYLNREKNPLLFSLALGYVGDCQQWFLKDRETTEEALWQLVQLHPQPSFRLQAFRWYRGLASTPAAAQHLYKVWKEGRLPDKSALSESDAMRLSYQLAVLLPDQADVIVKEQMGRIKNPDRQKEYAFISPAVSPNEAVRDSVFNALLKKENRRIEPWASRTLSLLNHPLRQQQAVKYILPALNIIEEVQRTGDIFFPRAWARSLLYGHTSQEAADAVDRFLQSHKNLPVMLTGKVKQQAGHLPIKGN